MNTDTVRVDGSQLLLPTDRDYKNAGMVSTYVSSGTESIPGEYQLAVAMQTADDSQARVKSFYVDWGACPPLRARIVPLINNAWDIDKQIFFISGKRYKRSQRGLGGLFTHSYCHSGHEKPGQSPRIRFAGMSIRNTAYLDIQDQAWGKPTATLSPKISNLKSSYIAHTNVFGDWQVIEQFEANTASVNYHKTTTNSDMGLLGFVIDPLPATGYFVTYTLTGRDVLVARPAEERIPGQRCDSRGAWDKARCHYG